MEEIHQYQLTDYNALVKEIDAKGKIVPNLKSNKSSAINDFISKAVPEAFQDERPITTHIILEGENILAWYLQAPELSEIM